MFHVQFLLSQAHFQAVLFFATTFYFHQLHLRIYRHLHKAQHNRLMLALQFRLYCHHNQGQHHEIPKQISHLLTTCKQPVAVHQVISCLFSSIFSVLNDHLHHNQEFIQYSYLVPFLLSPFYHHYPAQFRTNVLYPAR